MHSKIQFQEKILMRALPTCDHQYVGMNVCTQSTNLLKCDRSFSCKLQSKFNKENVAQLETSPYSFKKKIIRYKKRS